ncbi:Uncharacterized protein dnm_068010 [Desulfonema magnum]|uniref:Uncharacterized protein n=1 Tax=Desulfonema magnum TaxID=45655 RepID=A0A975BSE9_9BACT|nr:Uncharacterized protein dnm_068010 [Desulfonema magnum]
MHRRTDLLHEQINLTGEKIWKIRNHAGQFEKLSGKQFEKLFYI